MARTLFHPVHMADSYRIQTRQIRQHSGLHCRTSRSLLCIHHWHISIRQVCRPLVTQVTAQQQQQAVKKLQQWGRWGTLARR